MSRLASALLLGTLLAVSVGCDGTNTPAETRSGTATASGGLSVAEVALAERAARWEIAREEAEGSSASAVARRGVVTQPNTGAACDSGRLLRIRLIGSFPHIVTTGVELSEDEATNTVRAVLLTADAESGEVCLIGVRTGEVTPYAGGAVLDVG